MGVKQNQPFQLSSNASPKVDFQGSRVTSDGGLVLVRELDERLGFGDLIAQHLTDSRSKNTKFALADLLRQSVYSRLAGYEDVNDAERLSQDPTFRLIGSEKIWEGGAAMTSRLQSFETELLTQEGNLDGLTLINRELTAKAGAVDSPQRVVLDTDSTEIPVNGQQEHSAYNGHFESTCYHPLLLFNREGDCLAAKLRHGDVHGAKTGKNCCCRRSSGSRRWARKWSFAPTRLSPSRRSTRRWRNRGLETGFKHCTPRRSLVYYPSVGKPNWKSWLGSPMVFVSPSLVRPARRTWKKRKDFGSKTILWPRAHVG